MATFNQIAAALYPRTQPQPKTDRELALEMFLPAFGYRKLPEPSAAPNPYTRGASSPLGGTAKARGQR